MGMDYDYDDGWYSEEELNDETEDELPSTQRQMDPAIRMKLRLTIGQSLSIL